MGLVKGGLQKTSEWVEGLKEGSGPLAKPADTRAEAGGRVAHGMLAGAAAGAGVAVVNALMPGVMTPKRTGATAIAAGLTASFFPRSWISGYARDAAIGLAAIATKEMVEGPVAARAGTTAQVAQAKSSALAAHGDTVGLDGAEDPLLRCGELADAMVGG